MRVGAAGQWAPALFTPTRQLKQKTRHRRPGSEYPRTSRGAPELLFAFHRDLPGIVEHRHDYPAIARASLSRVIVGDWLSFTIAARLDLASRYARERRYSRTACARLSEASGCKHPHRCYPYEPCTSMRSPGYFTRSAATRARMGRDPSIGRAEFTSKVTPSRVIEPLRATVRIDSDATRRAGTTIRGIQRTPSPSESIGAGGDGGGVGACAGDGAGAAATGAGAAAAVRGEPNENWDRAERDSRAHAFPTHIVPAYFHSDAG